MDIRGSSKWTEDGRRMMAAATGHGTGMVLRQVEADHEKQRDPRSVRTL